MIGTILMGIVDSISADSSSIAVAHFGDTGVSWFICQLSLGELLTILVAISAACPDPRHEPCAQNRSVHRRLGRRRFFADEPHQGRPRCFQGIRS